MDPKQFRMTTPTQARLQSALEPLSVEQRTKALDAIAALSAEISLFARAQAAEELRQNWGYALQTMLSRLPDPKKS